MQIVHFDEGFVMKTSTNLYGKTNWGIVFRILEGAMVVLKIGRRMYRAYDFR